MPRISSFVRLAALLLAGLCLDASVSQERTRSHVRHLSDVNEEHRFHLKGDLHGRVRSAAVLGPVDPATEMKRMVLGLRVAPEAQARLDALLASQQDPASPDYHKWLTPEDFKTQFAPSAQERQVAQAWLESHGFTTEGLSQGGLAITFSGTAGQVEKAFRTSMRHVVLDGRRHLANVTDPSIPMALSGVVQGVLTLHDIPLNHTFTAGQPLPSGVDPLSTTGSTHALVPGDFARIYNLLPLYAAGLDGTGQTVAVVGRCNINLSDTRTFRSSLGLAAKDPVIILNGADPGNLGGNEELEANLDVQWAGGIARNATVKFVVSPSTSTDGVYLSAQYIVNNQVAPVMTISFGLGERLLGTSENAWINNLFSQAAAQGITVLVSSGDTGSSACYPSSSETSVSGLSSTPYNVCVGGTLFSEGSGTYWSATNNADGSSVLGYIPEVVWNEGSGSTGGGVSSIYAKPAWQVAPGVPADGARDVPDVSLSSASHDGYLIYMASHGGWMKVAGTSAAAPSFAGLVSLLVQRTGAPLGNILPTMYKLGVAQYQSGGTAVYHDITSGTNAIYAAGYNAGPGYDCATGLGSVDATAFVNGFLGVTLTPSKATPQAPGTAVTFTAAGSGGSGSYEYQFYVQSPSGVLSMVQAYGTTPTFAWSTTGLAAGTYTIAVWMRNAGTSPAAGYNTYATLAYTLAWPAPAATLAAGVASPQSAGQNVTFTAGATGGAGSYEYQFFVQAPGGAVTLARAYATTPTYAWPTTGLAAGAYTIAVWVRNAGTSPAAGYDTYATAAYTLTVPQVALAASKASPQGPGASVTFTATGSGGSGSYEYQFYVQNPAGTVTLAQAYSTTATFPWSTSGLAPGTYTVAVWMRNAGTSPAPGYNTYASTAYVLAWPAPAATLAAGAASPQSTGQTVTFTAGASGGSGNYEYQFYVQAPSGTVTLARTYAATPTFAWATTGLAAGTYTVAVWVRNAGTAPASGYDSYATLSYVLTAPRVTLAASKASPQGPGTAVTFTAAGSGGSGSYEYQFYVQNPAGTVTLAQAYGTTATFAWTTTGLAPGTYTLAVWMRNAGTAPVSGYNTYASMAYTLAWPAITTTLAAGVASPQSAGQNVTFTAGASGGSGSFEYQFWVQPQGGASTIKQAYSSTPTYTWPTSGLAAGTYTVAVWTRNAGTAPAAGYDSYGVLSYVLTVPQVALSADKAGPQAPGTTVTFTSAGSGGSGSYEYQYYVQSPAGTVTLARAYSSTATFAWATTGLAPGTYTVAVWMRNAGTSPAAGYNTYATATFTLAWPAPAATLAAGVASPQSAGQNVTFTAGASGGSGSYEYQFWIQPPGGAAVIKQAYSTTATYTWPTTGLPAGLYTVAVWVRNAGTSPAAGYDSYGVLSYTLTVPQAALASDKASPQTAGGTITFTASGSGGSGSYEFQYYVQAPSGTVTLVRAYASTPTYAWNTTGLPAGTYTVAVWLRNAGTSPAPGYNAYATAVYLLR